MVCAKASVRTVKASPDRWTRSHPPSADATSTPAWDADPEAADRAMLARHAAAAREAGMTVVEVGKVLDASPERGRFLCLDGIHMTEPYHRLMAKQWLGWLVGARPARLE